MKNLLLIILIQFTYGAVFSQEPTAPEPKVVEPMNSQKVIYEVVDEPAGFTGGMAALQKYIAENLIYPETAKESGLQGKCFLQFVVSENGYISDVKVKKGVTDCPECDKEAIRLVKGMPKWKPGEINGRSVNSVFSLPVSFKLQ
ncbi:MAG: energy transducer TonB [Fluviicola sp.]